MKDAESLDLSVIALTALREMYGDIKATFKSGEQMRAVKLALRRKVDVLTILPTGGGKSLVFQLPAWVEKDLTTVVIVPFVALAEEMKDRCIDMGLSCYVWRDSGTILTRESAQVVIVGVEHAVHSDFQQLLIQMEGAKKLARIVLDECHIVLTQREFRPDVRRLGSVVRCVSVQLMLLTATLPVKMMKRLRIMMGCEKWKRVRRIEDRAELRYRVIKVSKDVKEKRDLDREVGKLLREKLPDFEEDDRAIVYCLQREWAEELAGYLNEKWGDEICGVYHANMDLMERREVYSKWKNGDIMVIAATSALGAGIDHGGVRLVIHHGYGRNMIDLCQESGRGGRDGKAADAVTIFWKGIVEETNWITEKERGDVLRWIESDECRKKMLGRYLNGVGRDCLSGKVGEICDNCEKRLKEGVRMRIEEGIRVRRGLEAEMMEVEHGTDLKEMVRELRGRCMMCWMNKKENIMEHELSSCR
jgi:superfamily II DNA helicase RecQ